MDSTSTLNVPKNLLREQGNEYDQLPKVDELYEFTDHTLVGRVIKLNGAKRF